MTQESLFQEVKRTRISDTVVEQILALIEGGRLKAGDQLPGERELVEQLRVGRATVREALDRFVTHVGPAIERLDQLDGPLAGTA